MYLFKANLVLCATLTVNLDRVFLPSVPGAGLTSRLDQVTQMTMRPMSTLYDSALPSRVDYGNAWGSELGASKGLEKPRSNSDGRTGART